MTYLLRSQGQFSDLDQIRDLVVLTKTDVPVYLKDIAEVKDSTEDVRSMLRINGKPGVRMNVHEAVGHQHGADRASSCARRSSGSTARCRA